MNFLILTLTALLVLTAGCGCYLPERRPDKEEPRINIHYYKCVPPPSEEPEEDSA